MDNQADGGAEEKLEEQIKELTEESRKDDLITFEELGIDSIMVDEAHGFKNLAIFSKMNNVAGISSSGQRSLRICSLNASISQS